jgi:hypothetical protein
MNFNITQDSRDYIDLTYSNLHFKFRMANDEQNLLATLLKTHRRQQMPNTDKDEKDIRSTPHDNETKHIRSKTQSNPSITSDSYTQGQGHTTTPHLCQPQGQGCSCNSMSRTIHHLPPNSNPAAATPMSRPQSITCLL